LLKFFVVLKKKLKGGTKEMDEIKMLVTKIGELVSIDIDEIDRIVYDKDNLSIFIIKLQNKKQYKLTIKKIG